MAETQRPDVHTIRMALQDEVGAWMARCGVDREQAISELTRLAGERP